MLKLQAAYLIHISLYALSLDDPIQLQSFKCHLYAKNPLSATFLWSMVQLEFLKTTAILIWQKRDLWFFLHPPSTPYLLISQSLYMALPSIFFSGENQAISLDSFLLLLSHMMRTPICLHFTFFASNRNSSWAPVQNEDYMSQLLLQLTVDLWLSFGQLDVNRSVKQPLFISLSFLLFWCFE